MYTISQVAEQFGVTARTLRYYEELGLLQPRRNTSGRQRMYANRELVRIKLILRGKQLGFSLEEIKDMITLFEVDPNGKKQLERSMQYGEKRIEEVERKLRDLTMIKKELESLRADFINRLGEME
ncbi:MerR family DNA-binding transcriptional regulator [Bacillus sp. AGMB 02131]|uniref:MerR family DNA-binding transcriptional regulator n=1 Tax=Peribacillus faecalis TaxID=2772559 RepID=A0A927CU86_9BACI|nr:MerR family DNA-binding transcriptional regulator [Peribacillus faecalis]MBD3107566.1 MerR family DNA-binding transcriptional regulator [Peribacillus faecalis]